MRQRTVWVPKPDWSMPYLCLHCPNTSAGAAPAPPTGACDVPHMAACSPTHAPAAGPPLTGAGPMSAFICSASWSVALLGGGASTVRRAASTASMAAILRSRLAAASELCVDEGEQRGQCRGGGAGLVAGWVAVLVAAGQCRCSGLGGKAEQHGPPALPPHRAASFTANMLLSAPLLLRPTISRSSVTSSAAAAAISAAASSRPDASSADAAPSGCRRCTSAGVWMGMCKGGERGWGEAPQRVGMAELAWGHDGRMQDAQTACWNALARAAPSCASPPCCPPKSRCRSARRTCRRDHAVDGGLAGAAAAGGERQDLRAQRLPARLGHLAAAVGGHAEHIANDAIV